MVRMAVERVDGTEEYESIITEGVAQTEVLGN